MAVQKVLVKKSFNFSQAKLFAFMSVHENMDLLFAPIKSKLHIAGADAPYGVGSVRRMTLVGQIGAFEETITVSEPNSRIEYKVTKGSPLKNHHGIILIGGDDSHSTLEYSIVFEAKIPFIGPVLRANLQRSIEKGLATLAKRGL